MVCIYILASRESLYERPGKIVVRGTIRCQSKILCSVASAAAGRRTLNLLVAHTHFLFGPVTQRFDSVSPVQRLANLLVSVYKAGQLRV